jgi:N-acetylmuramoyl-L-alanine amidase
MLKHICAVAIGLLVAGTATAAPSARTLYLQAADQEQAVRAAWTDSLATPSMLKDVRRAIASYESVVRNHPTSGYCDDALWQAGRLALDAFAKVGEIKDRDTGVRLLHFLASEYPMSKFSKQVPATLAAIEPLGTLHPSAKPPFPEPARPVAAPKARDLVPSGAAPAVPTPRKQATILHIQRAVLPDVVRVTIGLDAEVSFHDERISGPPRIFIDFPSTQPLSSLGDRTLRFGEDQDVVREIRVGRHPNTLSRVVLDAVGVSSYSIYPLYDPYRLIIDCVRGAAPASAGPTVSKPTNATPPIPSTRPVGTAVDRSNTSAPAAASALRVPTPIVSPRPSLPGRRIATPWGRTLPLVTPKGSASLDAAYDMTLPSRVIVSVVSRRLPRGAPIATSLIADALAPARPEAPAGVAASAPPTLPAASTPPPATPFGGVSMARQLGLGVSRIVIDPGHGGHDPGAKGKGGSTEAELVLDVSLRLQKLLEQVKGVEVILTRQADEFVALPERTAIANREGADLFLSVHANASPNDQARGIETYFLNFANNLSAASVAARENAASGQAMGALPDFVKAIALNNKLDESHDFAAIVQESMVERLRTTNKLVKDLGVKQAPFVVLIGASMPSVLAEISFLTHEQEAKLLKSGAYRQRIAEALFNAVRKYQTSLKRVQTAAVR